MGHNGDHLYYASTALQYAGVGYEESLQQAAAYFDYPFSPTRLDLGYLNPVVAPLIYPRVVLGLIALPAVRAWGVAGIWLPGLLCGALSVLVLTFWAGRRAGPVAAVVLPVMVGSTWYAPEFMFGIYAESPVILATALLLVILPLGTGRRTWWHAVAAAGLVPLMMLSRQVPLQPVGIALGGYVWALAGTRRLANPWWPFVATMVPATVVSYGLVALWAPYDVLSFLYAVTRTSTPGELLGALPAMWSVSMGQDWARVLDRDLPLLVVVGTGLLGLVLACRHPIAGVFLGTLVSAATAEFLNGQPNDFRYAAPTLPVLLVLAAFAVAAAVHALVHLAGRRPPWPGRVWCAPARLPEEAVREAAPGAAAGVAPGVAPRPRRTARTAPIASAGAVWFAVAGCLAGAIASHSPGGAGRRRPGERDPRDAARCLAPGDFAGNPDLRR